jgi:L-threonylcarbamoyladenylate synthase
VNPSFEGICEVVAAIQQGKIIIYPTDTLYGLGANALNPHAVARIFQIKERPSHQALPIAVSGRTMATRFTYLTEKADRLITAFWPGALTLILRKKTAVLDRVAGERGGIGVRAANHVIPLTIIQTLDLPLTATSANKHGGAEPIDVEGACDQLGEEVDLVVDGGRGNGVASTVLDLLKEPPKIVRRGPVTRDMIEAVIGPVETA